VGSAVFDAMFNSTLATQVGMLKGQCHEMNYFFGGLKNQISTFCICSEGF
jgi:hypothetical protein